MSDNFRQTPSWEELFHKVINKAKACPVMALSVNNIITAEKVEDAAGNNVFDDYFEFWGITETQGHEIRSVFQRYSTRRDEEFEKYITDLINTSRELELRESRQRK